MTDRLKGIQINNIRDAVRSGSGMQGYNQRQKGNLALGLKK